MNETRGTKLKRRAPVHRAPHPPFRYLGPTVAFVLQRYVDYFISGSLPPRGGPLPLWGESEKLFYTSHSHIFTIINVLCNCIC